MDIVDYFRAVRLFLFEINHSTGMAFDLEGKCPDRSLNFAMADSHLQDASLWDFVKLTATTRLVAIHNSIGARKRRLLESAEKPDAGKQCER